MKDVGLGGSISAALEQDLEPGRPSVDLDLGGRLLLGREGLVGGQGAARREEVDVRDGRQTDRIRTPCP
jgi:hypothetical protein